MRTATRTLLVLVIALLLASPLSAAEKKRKGERGKKKPRKLPVAVFVPKSIELTDDQKAKVDEINKEYGPKLVEFQKKMATILTPEQRKARGEAFKAAREAGKKGEEMRKAVQAALKLSDDQKKKLAELQKEQKPIRDEARKKFIALLTPEQKAKLPGKGKGRGKGKGGAKKPRKKAPQ